MEWLFILALGVWVWLQSRRIETLARQVELLAAPLAPPIAELPQPQPANDALEELLLDTPLPPEASLELTAPASPIAEPQVLEPLHEPPPPPPPEVSTLAPRRKLGDWIAENGFVWLGAALAVVSGGALLTYAAQQGFFTPAMRLAAAVALGVSLVAASEWVRRFKVFNHPLAAAAVAGAGAAVLYACAWASYALLHFVEPGGGAVLLAGCALLLFALALLHGEALGVLAIAGAMLAPPLTSVGAWTASGLSLFVVAVALAGFVVASAKRWAFVAAAAIAGLYVWFAQSLAAGDAARALLFLCFAAAGAAAIGWRDRASKQGTETRWAASISMLPTVAICLSSVFSLWAWFAIADAPNTTMTAPMLSALLLAALAAGAVRAQAAPAAAFTVATAAAVLGVLTYAVVRGSTPEADAMLYGWGWAAACAVAIAAFAAKPNRRGRDKTMATGAIGAGMLALIAALSANPWSAPAAWGPLMVGAGLMGLAAELCARSAANPEHDRGVGAWVGACAVLAMAGMESLSPPLTRPAAQAAVALGLAALLVQRGWRMAGLAAITAGALAFAHALSGGWIGPALSGEIALWRALAVLGGGVAFLFSAARLTRVRAAGVSEGLASAALLFALLAGSLLLRWIGAGRTGAALDPFTEASLHALMLVAAGYITLPREASGPIAQIRSHLLMGVGLAFILAFAGWVANPWWGVAPAAISGPLIFNTLLLAFAAPGALALAAARKLLPVRRRLAIAYAGVGGLLAALWLTLEIRRGFHAPMSMGAIGVIEAHAYGVAALAASLGLALYARRRALAGRIVDYLAIVALAIAALFMVSSHHPWWGQGDRAAMTTLAPWIAAMMQGFSVALALLLARAISRGAEHEWARFAASAGAALFALSSGHAAIHALFAPSTTSALQGIEGLAHAAWPLALVLAGDWLTAHAPARAYFRDLKAIWAAAVWPALIWAVLGLCWVFNPWWGVAGAVVESSALAVLALGVYLATAWLSARAPQIANIPARAWFAPGARAACVALLFTALSLTIRHLFQGTEMNAALQAGGLETWTYSALWALFGAAVLALGARRKDDALRWSGIVLLLYVTAKVMLFDMSALSGVIRAASALVVGALLVTAALFARRFRAEEPPAG